ncbi:isocitrate lyase/PEP mutase family protein [Arthrobacter cryoconiti]|uniref:Isocitrate lyase/phosphoenolpyruvate mutase family protein n=1 Tax=Arthrobacter cryoconiti TaxID=748907 RepID=A0ABV8R3P7_9MICC|nr:isocitrate lyase/phosphoenolpyruvate mutase family protein [Arthrobacter cryoconiti]MCC9066783.1 isocitrate lyase/phosphoenolpyruvate mutase family protein [Arthrobacter cryoconiti]
MATFRELHHANAPLLLPNAWDMGSALAFATAGFSAIGTTSFGIAASAGKPDGDRSSQAATLALLAELVRLPVHITADIEDGYSSNAVEVASFVAELAAMGVAGINLEDSTEGQLIDPSIAAAKIDAIKKSSPDIFINARVDNMWIGEQATVDAILLRAHTYTQAGADGIFVPSVSSSQDIRAITTQLKLPVNVLAHPTLSVAELGQLGVQRVSSGSLPYRCAVDAGVNAAIALRDGALAPTATPYAQMQLRLGTFRRDGRNTP